MKNLRKHGTSPFSIAVIHGGPGARGEMAPVAEELARDRGILEPLQTATTLAGQVEELRLVLEDHGDTPLILIGYSWGAWLSYLVAASYPPLVKKLILVGSGPFEERYVSQLLETRLSRLSEEEREEYTAILKSLGDPATPEKTPLLARLGDLSTKTDAYDPLPAEEEEGGNVDLSGDLYQRVWESAAKMRQSGELLERAKAIRCPVVAIHGDYDPHPAEGVQKPLSNVLRDFRFLLLEKCRHTPWRERYARDAFYVVVREEIQI